MKATTWAAGSLFVGVTVLAQSIAANNAVDELGRGVAATMTLETGWTFYPATHGGRVVGFLAVLPADHPMQAAFNVLWYERDAQGRYAVNVWPGWEAASAASSLREKYGAAAFSAPELEAPGDGLVEDSRFVSFTPTMGVVDPIREALEVFRHSGMTDGPSKVGGNGSDSGDGCGSTTEFVLDPFARRVEIFLFGEPRTPVSTVFGCCFPRSYDYVYSSVPVWDPYPQPDAFGGCKYTGHLDQTYRTCQLTFDCALINCGPVQTRQKEMEPRKCPGTGPDCPPPPPPC